MLDCLIDCLALSQLSTLNSRLGQLFSGTFDEGTDDQLARETAHLVEMRLIVAVVGTHAATTAVPFGETVTAFLERVYICLMHRQETFIVDLHAFAGDTSVDTL